MHPAAGPLNSGVRPMKRFAISASEMQPIAEGWGGCIASDRITVDGRPVGYCYREAPDNQHDSGWRFLAGDESEEYMDDSSHHEIYDINTIANYDPAIASILSTPAPCAFERGNAHGFVPVIN